jgi:hypothetical protein
MPSNRRKMTDLEMTKLCAEAMGLQVHGGLYDSSAKGRELWIHHANGSRTEYDPLHDDAQAMALVKKFNSCMRIRYNTVIETDEIAPPYWEVRNYYPAQPPNYGGFGRNVDLNRAIVECVANMQSNKP